MKPFSDQQGRDVHHLSFIFAILSLVMFGLLTGCGGASSSTATSSTTTPTPTPETAGTPTFSPAAGTYTGPQTVTISTTTATAKIYYTVNGTTPTSASTLYTAPITVAVSETVSAIAVASGLTNSAVGTAQYVVQPLVSASASSFSFAPDVIGNAIKSGVATITNAGSSTADLSISLSGNGSYMLAPSVALPNALLEGCGSQLPAGASCSLIVQYLPSTVGTQTATVTVASTGGAGGSVTVALTGTAGAAPTGNVAATSNPLVAMYSVTPQFAANVTIQFGTDTTYGLTTSAFTSFTGGSASIQVAGMRANTTYHMRASIAYVGGGSVTNADQTFTTGALPPDLAGLNLTVTTAPGMTPQAGIELMNTVNSGPYQPYAVDLEGNVIWYYPWPDYAFQIDGLKQMTNGNMIAVIGVLSSQPLTSSPDPTRVIIREFDLVGNTVKQLTLADLNTSLTEAGYSITLQDFHHDIEVLPNGHWLILANTLKMVDGINVLGDVVVDVDTDLKPKFVWNEFDYFDTNRRPMMYPDWTHTNAVVYSPGDGNFMVSMRHQNWIAKVNYQNGAGDGSVIWTLGYQGNFALVNGVSPIDWPYAQHAPAFVGSATAGVFDLVVMDNGDDRIVSGVDGLCGVNGNEECYSTVPTFQINETDLTATVLSRVTFPTSLYNSFGGNAEVLANGNLEYDLCGVNSGSVIQEVMQDSAHTLVWSLIANGNSEYRSFRTPSLYPNVEWPNPQSKGSTSGRITHNQVTDGSPAANHPSTGGKLPPNFSPE